MHGPAAPPSPPRPPPLLLVLGVAVAALLALAAAVRAARATARPLRAGGLGLLTGRAAVDVQLLRVESGSNACLLVPFRLGRHESFLLLDTGYAGAPVLSARLLGSPGNAGDPAEALRRFARAEPAGERSHRALAELAAGARCVDYTSGCVLRLMGIGSSAETASDMLLCPALELRGPAGGYVSPRAAAGLPEADVLMTNHEMSSPHILTLDYLMHLAPCLVRPGAGLLRLGLGPAEFLARAARMRSMATELHGGAFVCRVVVDGLPLRCTVDTGAGLTLAVGRGPAGRLRAAAAAAGRGGRHVRQLGIHGEVVCSDVLLAGEVALAGARFRGVPVFLNSAEVEATDGYVGLGLLAAFDLLVTPGELLARPNGLPAAGAADYAEALRPGGCAESGPLRG